MTGPQHYRTAIEILDSIGRQQAAGDKLTLADAIAAAQVHATLAMAAATAANIRRNGAVVGEDSKSDELPAEWSKAIWPTS